MYILNIKNSDPNITQGHKAINAPKALMTSDISTMTAQEV